MSSRAKAAALTMEEKTVRKPWNDFMPKEGR